MIEHHHNCTAISHAGGACSCEHEYGRDLWDALRRIADANQDAPGSILNTLLERSAEYYAY